MVISRYNALFPTALLRQSHRARVILPPSERKRASWLLASLLVNASNATEIPESTPRRVFLIEFMVGPCCYIRPVAHEKLPRELSVLAVFGLALRNTSIAKVTRLQASSQRYYLRYNITVDVSLYEFPSAVSSPLQSVYSVVADQHRFRSVGVCSRQQCTFGIRRETPNHLPCNLPVS
jgi:hypothetical protein